MKAEPMKRYLMQQLMPVLAKAMVDATDQHVPNPVQFVAEQLLEAGTLLDSQYVDPNMYNYKSTELISLLRVSCCLPACSGTSIRST